MTGRRAIRQHRGLIEEPASSTDAGPSRQSGAGPETLRALQRQAGNAAVTSLFSRDGPASTMAPAPAFLPVQRSPDPGTAPLPGKPSFTEEQYATWRRQHPRHDPRSGGTFEPDYLYKRYTPAWFTAQGYTFGLRLGPFGNVDIDVWIDSRGAGREFRVIRWTDSPGGKQGSGPTDGSTGQGKPSPPLSEKEKGTDLPVTIDPNADYDKLFGPPIARKEGIDAAFGEGNMVLHEDGSLVLYLDDGGQYVFRPVPGGRYVVYDPKGKRLSHVYHLPPGDIPDVDDDADD